MKLKKPFSLSNVPRCRWNVLDLVTIVARDAARGYIFLDVDMSVAERLRAQFSTKGEHVTITAILLKSIATAQRLCPQSLQGYLPFNLRINYHEIVAGFTVERIVENQAGVFFGIIEHPEEKSLPEIAKELKQYGTGEIEEVPRLQMEESFSRLPAWLRKIIFHLGMSIPHLRLTISKATFGLSSLGKYGVVTAFGPCVCACTFGIGTVEDRAVVREGQVTVRPVVTLALSYDQRILDAAPAASFMRDVKELLDGRLEDYELIGGGKGPGFAAS
jgi:pyruvate/2-oxoglutarate dehydrogenase complex dihydrolipoamide acyltransferase (E2) component